MPWDSANVFCFFVEICSEQVTLFQIDLLKHINNSSRMDLLLLCLSIGIRPFSKQFIWQRAEFVTKGNVQGNTSNNNHNNNSNIKASRMKRDHHKERVLFLHVHSISHPQESQRASSTPSAVTPVQVQLPPRQGSQPWEGANLELDSSSAGEWTGINNVHTARAGFHSDTSSEPRQREEVRGKSITKTFPVSQPERQNNVQ